MLEENRLLTTEEVSEFLSVNIQTVRKWLREGKLQGIKLAGEVWRVESEDLKKFIEDSKK